MLRSAHYTEQVSDNIYGIGGVAIDLIESWEELEPQATCKDQNSWNSIYNFRPESDECLKPFPKKNSFDPYDQNVTCKDGGFLQYHRDEIQENVWYHDPVVIGLAHLLPSGCPSLIKSYTKIAPYIDWIESIVVKKRFKDEDMSRTFEM